MVKLKLKRAVSSMAERYIHIVEVIGSSPIPPTCKIFFFNI